jgi:hypothetical protein
MIASFRSAILALGSGSLLVAATALSRDGLPKRPLFNEAQQSAARPESQGPARIVGNTLADDGEPSTPRSSRADLSRSDERPNDKTSKRPAPAPTAVKSPVFQNASLRSAVPFGAPRVVLKPQERLLATLDSGPLAAATRSESATPGLITRIYHPQTTSIADLARLIRPLLTPGVGTAVANPEASLADENHHPSVLIVRDRAEIVSQVDAIVADLEAAPKRIVIDALIADMALPDSVAPGWEIDQSHNGVIDAPPRTALNSLRVLGRARVIATNQLQVIDRQWASLEWTEGALPPAENGSADAPASALRQATRFRVRPSILADGLIRLEVHPTCSRRKEGIPGRPEVTTVTFTTDLVLHAGTTVLIAGSSDERMPENEPLVVPAKSASRAADFPKIEPRPAIRRQTVLLLMPRIAGEN